MPETGSSVDAVVRALVDEARRIEEDALFCCAGHSQEARFWNALQLWLGVPSTLLAALAGITSLGGFKIDLGFFGADKYMVTGVSSLVAAALVGLMTFLDPKGQATKHYEAMAGYQALLNGIRIYHQISCRQGGTQESLVSELKAHAERLSELHSRTPMISTRAASLAERAIRSGRYTYAVDRKNG